MGYYIFSYIVECMAIDVVVFQRSHQDLKEVVNLLSGGEVAKTVAQVCRRGGYYFPLRMSRY